MRVRIFTDGACSGNPGPGGWGIVINYSQRCKVYSGYELETTNNRMELKAIEQCLKKINDNPNKCNVYEIYSDSAYVVNSINNKLLVGWKQNGWMTTKGTEIKNQDLWRSIDKHLQTVKVDGVKVTIVKVKGHNGNTFNEMVDKVAREQSQIAKGLAESV